MFKSLPVHILITRNFIQAINLESGSMSSKKAEINFSSSRNVVSNFNNANKTIKSCLKELEIRNGIFSRPIIILMQQTEGTEGGLSDIERRALRDLAEMAGGKKVFISENTHPLSVNEALSVLKEGRS
jgi:hypothetical protein